METIYTKTAPDAIGPYSQAIKVGNTLYSSGQIAINPATGKVEATDIEGQSRQVMQNLAEVLKAAGASFDNVVKTTCFLADINASGRSSFMYNQNVFTTKNPTDQRLSLALAISGQVLGDRGAYRVHGGGFAGTIQAFVPNDLLEQYRTVLEGVFGEGTCHVLQVRPVGGACLA